MIGTDAAGSPRLPLAGLSSCSSTSAARTGTRRGAREEAGFNVTLGLGPSPCSPLPCGALGPEPSASVAALGLDLGLGASTISPEAFVMVSCSGACFGICLGLVAFLGEVFGLDSLRFFPCFGTVTKYLDICLGPGSYEVSTGASSTGSAGVSSKGLLTVGLGDLVLLRPRVAEVGLGFPRAWSEYAPLAPAPDEAVE